MFGDVPRWHARCGAVIKVAHTATVLTKLWLPIAHLAWLSLYPGSFGVNQTPAPARASIQVAQLNFDF